MRLREKKKILKKKYGLTFDQAEDMLKKQGGKCPICLLKITLIGIGSGRADAACVDHCHKTGKIRDLLCGKCNTAIGSLDDCPRRLERAFIYIKKHAPVSFSKKVR